MKILALEHENPNAGPTSPATLRAEAEQVWQLQQQDILREIHFRSDQQTAVLVLECASVADAKHQLSTLPLVKNGAITFELIPLRPYDGLARLFG